MAVTHWCEVLVRGPEVSYAALASVSPRGPRDLTVSSLFSPAMPPTQQESLPTPGLVPLSAEPAVSHPQGGFTSLPAHRIIPTNQSHPPARTRGHLILCHCKGSLPGPAGSLCSECNPLWSCVLCGVLVYVTNGLC